MDALTEHIAVVTPVHGPVVDVFVHRQVSVWHLGGLWRAWGIACGDLPPYLLPAGGWEL
ncbi:hypothetical protein ABT272_42595 [Streptomyces sp900105245]|uniref:Uncharacterized protein n=1 Tax=Streptomyces sp. 900105245 TaxID=3154379 RepID=A0ABV1UKQ1_9ACTN